MDFVFSFSLAILLAMVHILTHNFRFLQQTPRSIWLSLCGGVSVAYVFLRILPELHEGQKAFTGRQLLYLAEHHVFFLALGGLIASYAIEGLVRKHGSKKENKGVFWFHILFFSSYNFLIGFVLEQQEEKTIQAAVFYFLAMGAHFLVNDIGFQEHFGKLYHKFGRWILAASILLGWVAGRFTDLSQISFIIILSFLSGGIMLNVLKEELPKEKESRLWAFVLGCVLYAFTLSTI